MRSSQSSPPPRLTSTGLPRIVAQARAASARKVSLRRLEQALLDALPEPGNEQELEHHFRHQLRCA